MVAVTSTATAPGAAAPGPAPSPGDHGPESSARRRRTTPGRWSGLAFHTFFACFVAFAVMVLVLGAGAAVAAHSPSLHDTFHEWGLEDSLVGRVGLRMAEAAHTSEPWHQLALDYAFSVFNLGLALFLFWLRPRDRTARLLALGMAGTAAVFNLQALGVYEALPATLFEELSHDAFHLVAAVSYVCALLLFPDGRLVPRWPAGRLALFWVGVTPVLALFAYLVRGTSRTVSLVMFFGLLTPLAGVASQAYRHRRSPGPVERQQSRLLFWALMPALVVGLFALTAGIRNAASPAFEGRALVVLPEAIFRVFQPVFSIIPIALFMGLLRYRLWDIDRVLNRTVVYGVLAGFVSAVYVAVVVGVGSLVGAQQDGNLALSIAATGIVAVAFQPVRERVQRLANRLVYGERATPYEVLSEFSEKVAETPATDELLGRMARILAEGTAARRADVWLKVGDELRRAASWPDDDGSLPAPRPFTGPDIPPIDGVDRAVAVRHQGEVLGALTVTKPPNEPLTPTEDKLLADLGRQAGLVLRNVRLTADLLARLEELRASRQRLVAAQDEERRRIERNLHDGAQQELVALMVQLRLAAQMAEELDEPGRALAGLLDQLKAQTGGALESLRDLARGIYPPLLAAEGLPVALSAQCRKASIPVEVESRGVGRYPQETEAAVYFCCLEALQNVAKYADASKAVVSLEQDDGVLRFSVVDDGRGFDPACTVKGSGCQNMADRLEALDGGLEIVSAVGRGTTVKGRVPAVPSSGDPGT